MTPGAHMYVKLRNPNNNSCCLTFETNGEVHAENRGTMAPEERDAWAESFETAGYDTRVFCTHGGSNGMAQITIPGRLAGLPPLVILTNWNGWLTNHFGATVDRLHRYNGLPATV